MDEEVIPVLRVSDAVAAAAWYQRLGFAQEWEFPLEPPPGVRVGRTGRTRRPASEAIMTGTSTDADISLPAGIPRRSWRPAEARFHLVL